MGFIQLIELRTDSFDEAERLHEQWLAETEGKRTVIGERICRDRADPKQYVLIVEFDSYEDAMRNSEMPETGRIAAGLAGIADGPIAFRDLDVVRSE